MIELLYKVILYGCIGILIENIFTGLYSIYRKDWRAETKTYLWMMPVYGLSGVGLEYLNDLLNPLHNFFKACIYTPIFYFIEAVSGYLSKLAFGKILWDYGRSKWTPMGLINFKYAPYWFILALFLDPMASTMRKVINFLASVS